MKLAEAKTEIARLYEIGIQARASIVVFAKCDEDHEYALTHYGWFRPPEPVKASVVTESESVEVDISLDLAEIAF